LSKSWLREPDLNRCAPIYETGVLPG